MIRLSAPQHNIKGLIRLPGSKSISNRLLILSEVLGWQPDFQNLSDSRDTQLLQKAIEKIRIAVSNRSATKDPLIDVRDAGTDMRFLTALLSATEGEWTITGSERMKQRPVGELVNALTQLGAEIRYAEKEGFPPLKINGKKLDGGIVEINSGISSQFVSALLLIGASLKKGLNIILKGKTVSRPYIDMTVALLEGSGIKVAASSRAIQVSASISPAKLQDLIFVESDWSSASYWYAICALAGNAEIELAYLNQNSLQADSVLPELFKNLGVETAFKENAVILTSVKPAVTEFRHDFTGCPDIAQTLAITCFGLGIKAELSGLSTLKVKETDRIQALKTELEKLGALVSAGDDKITIEQGTWNLEPGVINTYNDHRIAMSFAPLALRYNSIRIDDEEVVRKSYPAFWDDLKSLGFNVNLQA